MTIKLIVWRRSTTIFATLLSAVQLTVAPLAAPAQAEWTLVTLARDGSWGVGTSELQGPAMASALRKCAAMSQENDCGPEITAVRRGWTLGILCGDHRVLVASKEFINADREAQVRECTLRTLYGDAVPACWRVITVDPDGFVTRGKPPEVAKVNQSR